MAWRAARPSPRALLASTLPSLPKRDPACPESSVTHLRGQCLHIYARTTAWGDLDVEPAPVARQGQERPVDPVHHGPVVFARPVEPGQVAARTGQEQVVALQPAE